MPPPRPLFRRRRPAPSPPSFAERTAKLMTAATGLVTVATAVLYVAGYLAVRFQLGALGLTVPLSLVDERYLFAGADVLFQLLAVVPYVVLFAIAAAALGRLLPPRVREWIADPKRLAWTGVAVSWLAIQLLGRHVLTLHDLLLTSKPPCDPAWLLPLAVDGGGWRQPFFLAGLLVLLVPPVLGLRAVWPRRDAARLAVTFLAVLTVFQLLLLPVHVGVLTAGKGMPRVRLPAAEKEAESAWRIWDDERKVVFLAKKGETRWFVVRQAAKVDGVEILWHEDLVGVLKVDEACR